MSTREYNIQLTDEGIIKTTKGASILIAKPIWMNWIGMNIDTGEQKANISYIQRGKTKELEIPRQDYMNPNNLMPYQKYGFDARRDNVLDLSCYMRDEEEEVEERLFHSKLGFGIYEDKQVFKHYTAIDGKSIYCGSYDIKPKGDRDKVNRLINEYIIPHPPALLIMLFSLMSVVVAYLSEVLESDTTILHIVGNTTTGKSTLCRFAISMFGYPGVKKNGLFFTYNTTDNALFKKLIGINGIPVAIDELSMANFNNQNSFVYKLANGTDKSRLNKDSELTESETWLGTVLSNGEKSLVNGGNKNAGIAIRVFEASNIQWTKSAEYAEKINNVCMNNYGFTGVEFAEFIMKKDKLTLKSRYEKHIKELIEIMQENVVEDNFTKRRVNKYALVYLTGKLYEEMADVELGLEKIIDLFIKIEKDSMKARNFDKSVIDFLSMYIDINNNRFEKVGESAKGEVWGRIKDKKDWVEVEINPLKFEQVIKDGGYEDKDVVLNELKKNGVLSCDKDRFTRKRINSSGIKSPMIVIKLFKERG